MVDDYNTMVRILRNLLRQLGFTNIDEASDARTALDKMRAKPYGLVISDTHMSPMSGVEFLQRVRADERTAATPVVMMGDAEDAQSGGAVLVKPFSASTLKRQLETALGAF